MSETTVQNPITHQFTESAPVTAPPAEDQEYLPTLQTAVSAADEKKAQEIVVLRLSAITSFTDYFVICSGASSRQVQAIADEVLAQLKQRGVRPLSTEGYQNAEWVLIDYGPMVVHIFSEESRHFYDLERLWRDAERVPLPVVGGQ